MKNFVREKENFETLAARSARDILERLRARHMQSEDLAAEFGAGHETPQDTFHKGEDSRAGAVARPVFTIEIDQPELAGSSIFIPPVTANEAVGWGIMTEIENRSNENSNFFSLAATIDGKVDDRTFISLCYEYFLDRDADEDGLQKYFEALRTGSINRRDVMKRILASEEAMILGKRIALMPDPTLWLANYIPDYPPQDPVPVFELRY